MATLSVQTGFLSQRSLVGAAETCHFYDRAGYYVTLYCPYSGCCGVYNDRYCCYTSHIGLIVGGVLGLLFLIGISIVSCCFCACCPVYQNRVRSRGVYITTAGSNTVAPNYNTISATTQTSKPPTGAYRTQPLSHQS
ncbi:hypothetical protein DPMN_017303 [Dreissena polymorpha]|uniref:Cysteine and tyrosine-rich protein 1 n=1 Tax=Dreissena polymorpha TaxID=45954 RepID=A0A9D4S5B3_DREPO|nr:hypothetical protein DPMN_017303 [Dreissena polymorpha]